METHRTLKGIGRQMAHGHFPALVFYSPAECLVIHLEALCEAARIVKGKMK